ncbi:MAG: hypothetical protein K1W34_13985 [Lachnospiraceae bacterium]
MKLFDLQDELEVLQSQLTIIRETANALELILEGGAVSMERANWILIGIEEKVKKSEEKARELVGEVSKICKILDVL